MSEAYKVVRNTLLGIALTSSMMIVVGCGNQYDMVYGFDGSEALAGREVQKYFLMKDKMDLGCSVEYDKSTNRYDILIYKNRYKNSNKHYEESLIDNATKEFVEKHFEKNVTTDK